MLPGKEKSEIIEKFELRWIPSDLHKDIIKRMTMTSFARMRRTTRSIGEYIEQGRHTYIKAVPFPLSRFNMKNTKGMTSEKLQHVYVRNREHYQFSILQFIDYGNDITELRRVAEIYRNAHIYVQLVSFINSAFIPEVFESLRPNGMLFEEFGEPLQFHLAASFNSPLGYIHGTVSSAVTLMDVATNLTGKSNCIMLLIKCPVDPSAIQECMKMLAQKEVKQNIQYTAAFGIEPIRPDPGFHIYNSIKYDKEGNHRFTFIFCKTKKGGVVAKILAKFATVNEIFINYCENLEKFEIEFADGMDNEEKTPLMEVAKTFID